MSHPEPACLVITGPTATGKTRLATALCRRFDGEIISADSRQVYRGLDIGTGKDLAEYRSGGAEVPVHLLDLLEPGEKFNLHQFVGLARAALAEIAGRGRLPVVCGGTPLYIHALLEGYELPGGEPDWQKRQELESLPLAELCAILQREAAPELWERTDRTQVRRVVRAIEIARSGMAQSGRYTLRRTLILAPRYSRAECHQRIEQRLRQRLQEGLVEEVEALRRRGVSREVLEWLGLEYRYVSRYLYGDLGYDEMFAVLLAHIRQFCKRQDIWFRKMEREGKVIHWIPGGEVAEAAALTAAWLEEERRRP